MLEDNEAFVQRVIASIESGVPMWRKGWSEEVISLAQVNPVTHNQYSGVNFLRLYMERLDKGYTENRWATFNQIKSQGWKLEKGAKGVPVYKYTEYDRSTHKIPDWEAINKMGIEERVKYLKENVYCCMTNSGFVFNADNIIGIPAIEKKVFTEEEKAKYNNETVPEIERIIANCDVPISYDGQGRAYYDTLLDSIHLPAKESFISKSREYATTLHEIAHSTGHKSRLNRSLEAGSFGEEYAKEELIAEFSSMLLSLELGRNMTKSEFENHTAYLENWAEALKKDYTEFYKAISEAKKVTNYVKENYLEKSSKQEQSPALMNMKNNLPKKQSRPVIADSNANCLE